MKNPNHGHVIGIPVNSVTYAAEPASVTETASLYPQSDSNGSTYCKQSNDHLSHILLSYVCELLFMLYVNGDFLDLQIKNIQWLIG